MRDEQTQSPELAVGKVPSESWYSPTCANRSFQTGLSAGGRGGCSWWGTGVPGSWAAGRARDSLQASLPCGCRCPCRRMARHHVRCRCMALSSQEPACPSFRPVNTRADSSKVEKPTSFSIRAIGRWRRHLPGLPAGGGSLPDPVTVLEPPARAGPGSAPARRPDRCVGPPTPGFGRRDTEPDSQDEVQG